MLHNNNIINGESIFINRGGGAILSFIKLHSTETPRETGKVLIRSLLIQRHLTPGRSFGRPWVFCHVSCRTLELQIWKRVMVLEHLFYGRVIDWISIRAMFISWSGTQRGSCSSERVRDCWGLARGSGGNSIIGIMSSWAPNCCAQSAELGEWVVALLRY